MRQRQNTLYLSCVIAKISYHVIVPIAGYFANRACIVSFLKASPTGKSIKLIREIIQPLLG
jgi:hypothetical protein